MATTKSRSPDDAQRTAEIETLWEHREPIAGTPAEVYLASRGLTASCDSLGWLPNMRGGEGALIAAGKDPNGKLVALQATYLQADGIKSPFKPLRVTWRGPHDWASRGVVWISPYDGSGEVVVCEGVEDGSASSRRASRMSPRSSASPSWQGAVAVGRAQAVVARDDDPPGSPGDNALYRGVVRQRGGGMSLCAGAPAHGGAGSRVRSKTPTTFLHDSAKVWEWLSAPPSARRPGPRCAQRRARTGPCRRSTTSAPGKRPPQCSDLAASRRWTTRAPPASPSAGRAPGRRGGGSQPEPDPIPISPRCWTRRDRDRALHQGESAGDRRRRVVVRSAHVLQRNDLHINISPRLYINSPVPGCGKTLLLEIIMALTPRSMMLSSISVRDCSARSTRTGRRSGWTSLTSSWMARRRSTGGPQFRTPQDFRLRPAIGKTDDGQFIREKFSTFTAMAFSGLKKLPDDMTARCIIVALQRAGADDNLEHLVDGTARNSPRSAASWRAGRRT